MKTAICFFVYLLFATCMILFFFGISAGQSTPGASASQEPPSGLYEEGDLPEEDMRTLDGHDWPLPEGHPDDEFWADRFGLWGTRFLSNQLNVVMEHQGAIYVGGRANGLGIVSAVVALGRWQGRNWEILGEFGVAGENVRDMDVDADGNIYIGGRFEEVNGKQMNNIAMWDGEQWHNLGSGMDTTVATIAVGSDGYVYAGGHFETAGGVEASKIAKWDGSQWHPLLGGADDGAVFAIEPTPDGDIYVGGSFNGMDGFRKRHIARYSKNNNNEYSWHPLGSGFLPGTSGTVRALHYHDGKMYVGGNFSSTYGTSANSIAFWDVEDEEFDTIGDGFDGWVFSIDKDDNGTIYAGGWFTGSGNESIRNLARWDGTDWQQIGDDADQSVRSILYSSDEELIVAGRFEYIGDFQARSIARYKDGEWLPVGGYGLAHEPDPSATNVRRVKAIDQDPDGNVYAGGLFHYAGGIRVNYIAKWDGNRWHALGQGTDGRVEQIVATEDAVYVSGRFEEVYQNDGTPVSVTSRVARWRNGSWSALPDVGFVAGMSRVPVLKERNGDLYAAGRISDGDNAIHVWNGSSWSSPYPEFEGIGTIHYLKFGPQGRLFVSGGGVSREAGSSEYLNNIAYFADGEWQPLRGRGEGRGTSSPPAVFDIADDGSVYVFGVSWLNHVVGSPQHEDQIRASAGRWHNGQWQALDIEFSHNGSSTTPLFLTKSLNNEFIFSGTFNEVNGRSGFNGFARYNVNLNSWEPYGSGVYVAFSGHRRVRTLSYHAPFLWAGGNFTFLGKNNSSHFGRFYDLAVTVSEADILMQTTETRQVTIGLTDEAPEGGVTVTFRTDDPVTARLSTSSITIPEGETEATETLGITAQNPGSTLIRAETGDYRNAAIMVRVGADLLVREEELELTEREDDILIEVPVHNEGADAGAFDVALLEEPLEAGAEQKVHSTVRISGLDHMASVPLEFEYVPEVLETNLTVVVDIHDEVDESDLTNNKVSEDLILPRLLFTGFEASIDAHPDPDTVGRFYTDLGTIENIFTAEAEEGVKEVAFDFAGSSEKIENEFPVFSASPVFMNELEEDDHELSFVAFNKFGIATDTLTAFVQVETLPTWLTDGIGLFWDADWLDANVIGDEVTFGLEFGVGGDSGPLSYSASVSDDLDDLQLGGSVEGETELSLEVVIPLNPREEWKATGEIALNQEFFGGDGDEPPVQVTVVLTEETLEELNALYEPGAKTLMKRSIYQRYPTMVPGVTAKVGGGFDLKGRIKLRLVGGVVDETFELIRTQADERTNITPGLDLEFKLVGGVEVVLGLLSGQLVLSPAFAVDVGASYVTYPQDEGLQVFASGEGEIGWKLVAAAFYGALEEEVASGNFGPWQIFDTEATPKEQLMKPMMFEQSVDHPQILPDPSMASDSLGTVMVAWLEKEINDPDEPPQVFYSYAEPGEEFSSPQTLASNNFYKMSPDIRLHPNGTGAAVWVQNSRPREFADTDPGIDEVMRYQDIWYAAWDGDNWSSPQLVTPETQGNERGDGVPAVATSPDNEDQMILWTRNVRENTLDREGLSIYYSHVDEGNIQPYAALTSGSAADLGVQATYVNDSTVVAIWLRDADADAETTDQFNIYYAVWDGESWSNPEALTNTSNQEVDLSINMLADGRALATWVAIIENSGQELDYELRSSIYDPDTDQWTSPEVVFESDRFIEAPAVHVDNRNIVSVLWEGYLNSFNSDLLVSLKDLREGDGEEWTDAFAITDDEMINWLSTAAIDPAGNQYIVNISSDDSDAEAVPKAAEPNFHGPLSMSVVHIQDNATISSGMGVNEFFIAPDLAVDEESFDLSNINTSAGYTADVDVTVRNQGAVQSDQTIARFYDGDPENGGSQVDVDKTVSSLKPGQETIISTQYDFAPTEVLYVYVDPDENLEEQSRDNNIASKSIAIRPDLRADTLYVGFDGNPEVGTEGDVFLDVTNAGRATAENVTVRFLENQTGSIEEAGMFDETMISSIDPGETVEISVTYTVTHSDTTFLFASVDPDDEIDELDDEHNDRKIWFRALPDIRVNKVWFDQSSVTVNAEVENAGGAPAHDFRMDLYRGHPLRKGERVDSLTVEELKVAGKDTIVFYYNPPEGRSDLYVWANRDGAVAELERGNNRSVTSVNVPGLAELVARLDMIAVMKEEREVTFSSLIKNQGTRAASGFEFELISRDDQEEYELLKRETVLILNADETIGDTLHWEGGEVNKTDFFLYVDPGQTVPDLDRTNNIDSLQVVFTSTESDLADVPEQFELSQNYPNPFNNSTIIEYGLPSESNVRIQIYNVLGRHVATLVDRVQSPGMHQLRWAVQDLATGVYLIVVDLQSIDNEAELRETIKALYLR